MELKTVKKQFNEILKNSGVCDAENNVNKILMHVLNINKATLLITNYISAKNFKKAKKLVLKRAKHFPLQYLLKQVQFCGNTIFVNKNVLIPRNETEQLCEMVFKTAENKTVLDLCSGSGCLGLGIKRNANADVTLSDVSNKALRVAKKNAKLNGLEVKFVKSNLFENIIGKFDIIVSNPPYIKTDDLKNLQVEVGFEPVLALDGHDDGLFFYKKIIDEAPKFLNDFGEIYFEIGLGQDKTITKLLSKHFDCIKIIKDYYNKNRFIYAKLKEKVC